MTSTDIKKTARRVLEEIFPADDEAALAELISEDFVNHEAPAGTPPGLASITYYMHLLASAFSDQRWAIHRVLAEGDTAVIYCTHSGRHTGEFFGLPLPAAASPMSRCTSSASPTGKAPSTGASATMPR